MGRKPKAENVNGKAPMVAELSSPHMLTERHNLKPELPKSPKALSTVKRLPKDKCLIVRRSNRLQRIVRPVQSRDIQVVEEINLTSEGEDEPNIEEPIHEPMPEEKSFEEKVDYLIQVVEELKSKGSERQCTSDELSYKSLYFDSLKKIEALNSELYQCNKKLEFALGKLETYESVKDVMDKLKEVILISNLGKATETVVNLSSQLTSSRGVYAELDAGAPQTLTANLSPTKKKKRGNKD